LRIVHVRERRQPHLVLDKLYLEFVQFSPEHSANQFVAENLDGAVFGIVTRFAVRHPTLPPRGVRSELSV
jgi:hypothetical protein